MTGDTTDESGKTYCKKHTRLQRIFSQIRHYSQNQEKLKIVVDELRSLIIIVIVMTKVSRITFVASFLLYKKQKRLRGDAHSREER